MVAAEPAQEVPVTTRLRFLGVAGYEIKAPVGRILIDPFLLGNPRAPLSPEDLETPDVILVTHAAPDHVGDTGLIARLTGAAVVCGADTRELLIDGGVPAAQVRATIMGIVVEVNGIVVRPVESHHWSTARLSDGRIVTGTPLGYIVDAEPGIRIYHWGDSAIFGDMRLIRELYRPDIALLGPTHPKELIDPVLPGPGRMLTGEMSPDEAALAAELLGVRLAVATHYLNAEDPEVAEFVRLVPALDPASHRAAIAPAVGQTVILDGERWAIEDARP